MFARSGQVAQGSTQQDCCDAIDSEQVVTVRIDRLGEQVPEHEPPTLEHVPQVRTYVTSGTSVTLLQEPHA